MVSCARIAIVIVSWTGSSLLTAAEGPGSRTDSRRAIEQLSRLGQPDGPNALCGGEPCDAVLRGLFHFFDRSPDGLAANGRSCGDCHMVTDRFQLSPANAEKRFQFLQWRLQFDPHADDPLFRPIDADDFRTNGEDASDFSNLRENGLVRITFDLPPNVKLIDPATNEPSAETFVDVWRAVPTVNDVKLTGPDGLYPWPRDPNRSGGYQLDARVGTLQEQALGALINHAQIQGAPSQQFLDDLHSFQRVLFTNSRVRDLADAIDAGITPLPDPDPPLNALEQQGKVVFMRACAHCHGGPAQSFRRSPGMVRYHDIGTRVSASGRYRHAPRFAFKPCPPRLARNARTYEVTLTNGTKVRRTTSDPGRELLTGFVDRLPRTTSRSSTCPGCAGSARPPRTSTTTAPTRWKRSCTTTSSSSSASRPTSRPARRSPGDLDERRGLRSDPASGGSARSPCLPEEALTGEEPNGPAQRGIRTRIRERDWGVR